MQTDAHSTIRYTAPGTPVHPPGDINKHLIDLPALIHEFCAWYSRCLADQQLQMNSCTSQEIPRYVQGNHVLLQRMLMEPASNSLLHAGDGDVSVTVEVQHHSPRRYTLSVVLALAGGSLSSSTKKHMFLPGTRLPARDGFRLRATNLYYARMIAANLGGDVRIDESSARGLRYLMEARLFTPPC